MKNYKLLLTGLLIAGLSACGGGGKKDSASNPSADDKNLVGSEDSGSPDVDDKSQSSDKSYPTLALLGGEGLGLVLTTWSATKINKLAALFSTLDDKNGSHLSKRLSDLATAKNNYEIIKASLANDVNGSMTPGTAANFEKLSQELRNARTVQRNFELALAEVNNKTNAFMEVKPQDMRRVPPIPGTPEFSDLIKNSNGRVETMNELRAQKAHLETRISESKVSIQSVEGKMLKLFEKNAKLYPVFRKYLLAKNTLGRVVISIDVAFSKMFRAALSKLISSHAGKLKWSGPSEKVWAESHSKPIGTSMSNARITYITASGFIIAGIGYTLWANFDEATSEAKQMVLDLKEVFDGDEITKEDVAEQSEADAEEAK